MLGLVSKVPLSVLDHIVTHEKTLSGVVRVSAVWVGLLGFRPFFGPLNPKPFKEWLFRTHLASDCERRLREHAEPKTTDLNPEPQTPNPA